MQRKNRKKHIMAFQLTCWLLFGCYIFALDIGHWTLPLKIGLFQRRVKRHEALSPSSEYNRRDLQIELGQAATRADIKQEIEKNGFVSTEYLEDAVLNLPPEGRLATYKFWKERYPKIHEGAFDPQKELDRHLEFTHYLKLLKEEMGVDLRRRLAYKDVSIQTIYQEFERMVTSDEGYGLIDNEWRRPMVGASEYWISKEFLSKVEKLGEDASVAKGLILRIDKQAKALGKKTMVIDNREDGHFVVQQIKSELEARGLTTLSLHIKSSHYHGTSNFSNDLEKIPKEIIEGLTSGKVILVFVDGASYFQIEGKKRVPDSFRFIIELHQYLVNKLGSFSELFFWNREGLPMVTFIKGTRYLVEKYDSGSSISLDGSISLSKRDRDYSKPLKPLGKIEDLTAAAIIGLAVNSYFEIESGSYMEKYRNFPDMTIITFDKTGVNTQPLLNWMVRNIKKILRRLDGDVISLHRILEVRTHVEENARGVDEAI